MTSEQMKARQAWAMVLVILVMLCNGFATTYFPMVWSVLLVLFTSNIAVVLCIIFLIYPGRTETGKPELKRDRIQSVNRSI